MLGASGDMLDAQPSPYQPELDREIHLSRGGSRGQARTRDAGWFLEALFRARWGLAQPPGFHRAGEAGGGRCWAAPVL